MPSWAEKQNTVNNMKPGNILKILLREATKTLTIVIFALLSAVMLDPYLPTQQSEVLGINIVEAGPEQVIVQISPDLSDQEIKDTVSEMGGQIIEELPAISAVVISILPSETGMIAAPDSDNQSGISQNDHATAEDPNGQTESRPALFLE